MKMQILTLTGLLTLVACSDGVPAVQDPRNIVVDGNKLTAQEFLARYCANKVGHPTCEAVRKVTIQDATKSKTGPARF